MIASWRLNCSHHPKFSWPFAFTYVLFYIMVVPWGGMAFNTKKLPGYVAVRRLIEADFFGYRNFCGSKSLTSESSKLDVSDLPNDGDFDTFAGPHF